MDHHYIVVSKWIEDPEHVNQPSVCRTADEPFEALKKYLETIVKNVRATFLH